MLVQQILHTMDREAFPPRVWEQYIAIAALRFSKPCFQYGERRFGDWRTALFASLADHAKVSADTEDEVFAFKPGHFGQAQASLHCGQQKGVVTPTGPST